MQKYAQEKDFPVTSKLYFCYKPLPYTKNDRL